MRILEIEELEFSITEEDIRRLYRLGFNRYDLVTNKFLEKYEELREDEDNTLREKLRKWIKGKGERKEGDDTEIGLESKGSITEILEIEEEEIFMEENENVTQENNEYEYYGDYDEKNINKDEFSLSEENSDLEIQIPKSENSLETTSSEDENDWIQNLFGIPNLFNNNMAATLAELQAALNAIARVRGGGQPDGTLTAFLKQSIENVEERIGRVEEEQQTGMVPTFFGREDEDPFQWLEIYEQACESNGWQEGAN